MSSRRPTSSAATGRRSSTRCGRDLRGCGSTSAPTRADCAVAAAAVGHDPGEPQNVEDVRIRADADLEHATLTYRGRAVELDIPTAITPSWFC